MKTEHDILSADPEFRKLLAIESLVAEASELVARLMAEQHVSKADLSRRLNKSRAWVTQLLSGKANMTVRTLAEVAFALDAEVKLKAQPPAWKSSVRPATGGWQPVVFKMDHYLVESPVCSEEVFQLKHDQMSPARDEAADHPNEDLPDSKYSA